MSRVLNNFCILLYKYASAFILGAGVPNGRTPIKGRF
ncbi:hypothetical protein At1D1108_42150 [Agrobacterium tumefaciens]|nr:hypothetical protein At1D1108_42150 [Agrobacterium tumefaciens]